MNWNKNVLICVDGTKEEMPVVAYTGQIVENRAGFRIRLLHILPPLPPQLMEFGGAESPKLEEEEETALKEEQTRWRMQAEQKAESVFKKAKEILAAVHVPAESIETHTLVPISGENLVSEIMEEAKASRCDTVVVGRRPFSWLERVRHHVADSLVSRGDGLTFWVVEEPRVFNPGIP